MSVQLLRMRDVMARVSLARSKIYELIADGSFPAPVRLGERAVRWRSDELDEWVERMSAKRNAA